MTLLLAMLAGLGASNASANEALDLLTRMQSAVRDLNYTGHVAYTRSNELYTFSITHEAGEDQETIVRLDSGSLGQAASNEVESFSLTDFDNLHRPAKDSYSFDAGQETQVAEQTCKVVVVRPKDKYRFLHRYCINPETGMLLKYSLMDRSQNVLEQLVFTQLEIGKQGDKPSSARVTYNASFSPTTLRQASAVTMMRPQTLADTDDSATDKSAVLVLDEWAFDDLPAGFQWVRTLERVNNGKTDQVILSDGMTSVSVFFTPVAQAEKLDDLSYAAGATHVLSDVMSGYLVTFVGEVPAATLQSIQKGLRHIQP